MRLGIDAREIQDGVFTGIGGPLYNFLQFFDALENDDTCVLFSEKPLKMVFSPKIVNVIIPKTVTFIWDQWYLPQAIKKSHVDLFYSPYYKLPILKSCTCVTAMLDLMYITFTPSYQQLSVGKKLYYAFFGRIFAHLTDYILTCSTFSKDDILRVYGVESSKIKVIPLSFAQEFLIPVNKDKINLIKSKFNINGRYLLYVGNFKIHKNVGALIKAFALIAKNDAGLQLVLAGPKEHLYQDLCKDIQNVNLSDRVIFTDKITINDGLPYMYQGAEAFVFPSLYEGFGIPPIEAMASGVVVIASQQGSLPEIVQDAGLLIDARDPVAIARAIRKILDNPDLKNQYIQKGFKRAQDFKTDLVEAQMYDFFNSLSHKSS